MVSIPLGLGDWESVSQNLTRLKLRNMYVVPNPSSQDGVSRVSRPTLSVVSTIGSGPISQTWYRPNVLDGDALIVSGTELYRRLPNNDNLLIGDLPGTGRADVAGTRLEGNPDSVFIVRDGILYYTDGTAISVVAVPDDQLVSSVATLNNYFIVGILGSQKFYWIEPAAITIDPLNFASAERIPDPIIAISVIADEIWFLGLSGPEVWSPTGDADAPFQRVSGRVYNEGCFSRDTVVSTAINGLPALIWVTDTKAVVKAQGSPEKISNESVEELLKTADDLSSWFFRYNRHDFYLITSSAFTLVYDITMNIWAKWDTYLKNFWVPQCGYQMNSEVFAGSSEDGVLYRLEEGPADGDLPVVREVSGFLNTPVGSTLANEVIAYVNSGWSPVYGFDPTLELRWSDDMGATWSDYVAAGMGDKGEYTRSLSYRSLGVMRSPGRIFELRISDKVRFRLDYCTLNERQR